MMPFPFECMATTGAQALATWEELKTAGRGVPVVIGSDESVGILTEAFNPSRLLKQPSLAEILATAKRIRHPEDLAATTLLAEPRRAPVGEWPAEPSPSAGLTVAMKHNLTPLAKVYIALIPADDWTTIPAHARWGGRDACPRAEYHVAALRSWRDRFGAELIGLSSDRMDLRSCVGRVRASRR
jgi:hypothetical protein